MEKKAIEGKGLAPAIGPYSAGVSVGDMIFTSGQIAVDPHSGELDQGTDIDYETDRVLRNLQAVLLAAGSDFNSVVKTTIFLSTSLDSAYAVLCSAIPHRYRYSC